MGWVDSYGLTHPVVADIGFGVVTRFVDGNSIGLPSMSLLGVGAEVLVRDDWVSASDIESALP